MLVSWVSEWSKGWMPHRRTFRNFTHWAWAIWDLSNHDLFQIIPDPGSQQRVTLSLDSICTIPFQARARDVKIPKLRPHSSNHVMQCFVNLFGTFRGTWNPRDKNPVVVYRCLPDIFWNIMNREIQAPGVPIARTICQVSLIRCTYDWHNCRSGRKLILCIPPPVSRVHLTVDSTTLRVSEAHRFHFEVCLKWEMCQEELNTFENIPVV